MATVSTLGVATNPGYEAPAVIATFPKHELEQDLPENLTPHVHAVQNS